jgi:hypothetical protein
LDGETPSFSPCFAFFDSFVNRGVEVESILLPKYVSDISHSLEASKRLAQTVVGSLEGVPRGTAGMLGAGKQAGLRSGEEPLPVGTSSVEKSSRPRSG